MTRRIVCFGFGFSARALARLLHNAEDTSIIGTTRSPERAKALTQEGYLVLESHGTTRDPRVAKALENATHVVVSASPDADGDPLLRTYQSDLNSAPNLTWVGYLSTIGVYGDQANAWVDENTPCVPGSTRGKRRVEAERAWQQYAENNGVALDIFRLAGIYGPGRSVLKKLQAGTARRIIKRDQVFNRIHVDDIAQTLERAIQNNGGIRIFNLADDEPAPPQDVIAFGATLLGLPIPPDIPFETADLTPMARSFYEDRRRIKNEHVKRTLGIDLKYPTYKEGLRAIAATMQKA